ncbi:MAG: hypothetical protein AAF989_10335 [Planctomycetota bacterium]
MSRFIAITSLFFFGFAAVFLIQQPEKLTEIRGLVSKAVSYKSVPSPPAWLSTWPPKLNQRYPDLVLENQDGEPMELSDLLGTPFLVELVAVPCKGCQAFAGANRVGDFAGMGTQVGLDSIDEYAKQYGGVELGRDIPFVQVLLYASDMAAPTRQETHDWAEHFGMQTSQDRYVLRGLDAMLDPETQGLIPGFQLIDEDFRLRFDSSGHAPQHDLYRELLPAIKGLLNQSPRSQVR